MLSELEAPALYGSPAERTLMGVLCPDWAKCAGIPEQCDFSFTAGAAGGETRVADQTSVNNDYCRNIEQFNTYYKKHLQQL